MITFMEDVKKRIDDEKLVMDDFTKFLNYLIDDKIIQRENYLFATNYTSLYPLIKLKINNDDNYNKWIKKVEIKKVDIENNEKRDKKIKDNEASRQSTPSNSAYKTPFDTPITSTNVTPNISREPLIQQDEELAKAQAEAAKAEAEAKIKQAEADKKAAEEAKKAAEEAKKAAEEAKKAAEAAAAAAQAQSEAEAAAAAQAQAQSKAEAEAEAAAEAQAQEEAIKNAQRELKEAEQQQIAADEKLAEQLQQAQSAATSAATSATVSRVQSIAEEQLPKLYTEQHNYADNIEGRGEEVIKEQAYINSLKNDYKLQQKAIKNNGDCF